MEIVQTAAPATPAPTGTAEGKTAASGTPAAATEPKSTGPAQTPEGKAPEGQKTDPAKPRDGARFAQLAQREAKIVERERQAKQLEAQARTAQQQAEEFRALQEAARKDPLKLLRNLGWDFDRLTAAALKGELDAAPADPLDPVKSEVESLKTQLEADRKAREEAEKTAHEAQKTQVVARFKEGIQAHLQSNPDAYELCLLEDNPVEALYEAMEIHYQQTGESLTVQEAADTYEKFLTEKAEKIRKAKRFQPKAEEKPKEEPPAIRRTLTNNLTASTGSTTSSVELARQRALAILNGAK